MVEKRSPRIGIIGAGAIGGYYGLLLARAGLDVHFLLRSDYAVVAEQGLQLDSVVHGQLHLNNLQIYADAASMPACDWLLVGAKTTSNAELAPLLVQIAAPGAKVVLLQNGLAVEEALRPLLPDSLHLLGGLCFICVHRAGAGQIVHQAYGGINLGYHSGPGDGEAVLAEGVALLRQAAIEANPVANLAQARWQKLVWNVPYNGLSVLLKRYGSHDAASGQSCPDCQPDGRGDRRRRRLWSCVVGGFGGQAAAGDRSHAGLSAEHVPRLATGPGDGA